MLWLIFWGTIVTCGGFGCYFMYDLYDENEKLSKKLAEMQTKFHNRQTELNKVTVERETHNNHISRLNKEIFALKVQMNEEAQRCSRLIERVRNLETEKSTLERKLQLNAQTQARLEQEIDELKAGNGLMTIRGGEVRNDVLYSLQMIFNYLQMVIPKEFPGILKKNTVLILNTIIDKSGQSHAAFILPPLVAINGYLIFTTKNMLGKIDASKSDLTLLKLLLNRYLLTNINKTRYAKIIFPFLDVLAKHWLTVELKLTQTGDSTFALYAYLHDPRGGGLLQVNDFQILSTTIEDCLNAKYSHVTLDTYRVASPYQSCRQSKPDRISCGPLVIKEIGMRLRDDTLDRSIPYQYGASEIVQQQHETYRAFVPYRVDALSIIATNRYRFLARTMGKNYRKEEGQSEKVKIELTHN